MDANGFLLLFYSIAHFTFKAIFHNALNSYWFDSEFALESVIGTKQY